MVEGEDEKKSESERGVDMTRRERARIRHTPGSVWIQHSRARGPSEAQRVRVECEEEVSVRRSEVAVQHDDKLRGISFRLDQIARLDKMTECGTE